MAALPLTLMLGVSPLAVLHIYPIVLKLINIEKVKVDSRYYPDTGIATITPKKKGHDKKPLHMKPLIFTGVGIWISFSVIYAFSVIRFIQYGNEVLSSENYHTIIPILHAVLSLVAIGTGFALTVKLLKGRISKLYKDNKALQPLLIPAAAISVNFIYIGCYFMPYMLLAFIHDPLLTTFTYLTLVLFIVCIYLICLGVCQLYKYYKEDKYVRYGGKYSRIKRAKFLDKLLYSCMVWAMAFSLIMFLFIVTYIITLGSFDGLKELKYLIIPSLPVAVVTLFIFRPALTFMSNKDEGTNNVDDGKEEEQQRVQNNDSDTTCQNSPMTANTPGHVIPNLMTDAQLV